jgi:hypothetical protein
MRCAIHSFGRSFARPILSAAYFAKLFFGGFVLLAPILPGVDINPAMAGDSAADLRSSDMSSQIFYTGLKAVDLFAPIPLGGDILISGEPKAGARVLGSEMSFRLANHPRGGMHVTVFLDSAIEDAAAYQAEFKESVSGSVELVTVAAVTPADILKHLGSASPLGSGVVGITKNESFVTGFRSAVTSARGSGAESKKITSLVVTEGIAPSGFDARIMLIRALAVEGIYPPLDVQGSTSSVLAAAPRQKAVAELAKTQIGDLVRSLQPGAFKDPNWVYNQDPQKHPAAQAARFVSQPYFVAEPYTGLKSAYVSIGQIIDEFGKILAGGYNQQPLTSFYMRNETPVQPAQAVNQ